jgi:hypothetical protein
MGAVEQQREVDQSEAWVSQISRQMAMRGTQKKFQAKPYASFRF